MARNKVHCPHCGNVMDYERTMSYPWARNGDRILTYSCQDCTSAHGGDAFLVAIQQSIVADTIHYTRAHVFRTARRSK